MKTIFLIIAGILLWPSYPIFAVFCFIIGLVF